MASHVNKKRTEVVSPLLPVVFPRVCPREVAFLRACPRENNLSRVGEFVCLPLIRAIVVFLFFSKRCLKGKVSTQLYHIIQ
jgi:hypothetical protein